MSTQSHSATITRTASTLKLRGAPAQPATSVFPDLDKRGYTVVPGVISAERASEYVDRAYTWLESFGLGFDRHDEETWQVQNLPRHSKGGLYNRHGINHEQFVWDVRTEAGLVEIFSKIWGTDELLVSFDGANLSIPLPAAQLGEQAAPWPHVDQSPRKCYKHCVQGIMNLAENGPDDGGLMVLEGSFELFNQFFEDHEADKPVDGWPTIDSYDFTPDQMEWFYSKGCKWIKICANPGDVILWDSRCVHYGSVPKGRKPRVATYVCYKPARDIEPEMLVRKQKIAKELGTSSHDPLQFHQTGAKEKGKLDTHERLAPTKPPQLSERALKLAGLMAY